MRGGLPLACLGVLLHAVGVVAMLGETSGEDEDYVVHLTKANWEESLKKYDRMLVEFYTPGNDELYKEISKTSKMLKAEQLDSVVCKVDADAEKELVAQFKDKVKKYPTLMYFVKGQFNKFYDGKKDVDGITLWLKNLEYPPVKELKEEDVQKFLDEVDEDEFALVAHVKKKSARSKMFYKMVEDTLREWDIAKIKFAAVFLPKGADAKADSKMFMHRPGISNPDPERMDYKGTVWSEDKLTWWVQNCSYPTLGKKFTRNQYAPQSMEVMGWTAAIVGLSDDSTETEGKETRDEPLRPKLEEILVPFAVENPKWKFVLAEIEKLEDHELELLSVKYGHEPRIIVLGTDKKNYHLVGEEAITDEEKIREFFDDIQAGKQKPHYKSAPAADDEYDEDGSFILTGDTFEETVLDEDKDVFVEFYAPWCKHCKKLEPEWTKLVKKADKAGWKDRDVILAKFDATENECQEEVPSFPRMVLYPAGKAKNKFKNKQVYAGDRNAEGLFEFVSETARNLQEDKEEEEEDEDEEAAPKKRRRKGPGKKAGGEEL